MWVRLLVAVQVLVPTVALLGTEPPTRFGFQMYSGIGGISADVRDSAGDELGLPEDIVVDDLYRNDLPWTDFLPEQVCREAPDAATVTITHDERTRTVRCSDL